MSNVFFQDDLQTPTVVSPTTPLPVSVMPPVKVASSNFRSADSFLRPADTTAYAAKDAVSDSTSAPRPLRFRDVLDPEHHAGTITGLLFFTSQTTDTSRYTLHLFDSEPTAVADNAAYPGPLLTDWNHYLGSIDIGPVKTEGTGSTVAYYADKTLNFDFVCPNGTMSLYGLLEMLDTPTPASGQEYRVRLVGQRR